MTFLLAHLSDPHIGPLPAMPIRAMANKRLTGVLNWHRARATIHSMGVLEAIIADIRQHRPDHIALTGDLVNVGYPPEFPVAARMVDKLGSSTDVSVIPGNHDAYVRGSLPAMDAVFAPFMCSDGDGNPGNSVLAERFPYLRVRQNVAFIGINTGVPTAPFFATGTMGAEQGRKLEKLLEETRNAGLFRVVMLHHPPVTRGVKFGRGLTDARRFELVLRRHGAELVLHGHNHRFSLQQMAGPAAQIPVVGVGSASAVPGTAQHLAEYNLIRINPGSEQPVQIERRGITFENRMVSRVGLVTLHRTGN
ncbi:MAG: metallophosphoesterase [Beijerinckiaceae bacterium]|nr:metallophosphoesterase [Beijerinckiaceae bacterium]